jgi:hypothetical protein
MNDQMAFGNLANVAARRLSDYSEMALNLLYLIRRHLFARMLMS